MSIYLFIDGLENVNILVYAYMNLCFDMYLCWIYEYVYLVGHIFLACLDVCMHNILACVAPLCGKYVAAHISVQEPKYPDPFQKGPRSFLQHSTTCFSHHSTVSYICITFLTLKSGPRATYKQRLRSHWSLTKTDCSFFSAYQEPTPCKGMKWDTHHWIMPEKGRWWSFWGPQRPR